MRGAFLVVIVRSCLLVLLVQPLNGFAERVLSLFGVASSRQVGEGGWGLKTAGVDVLIVLQLPYKLCCFNSNYDPIVVWYRM